MFIGAYFVFTVSNNGNPIIYNNYIEIKYSKNLSNILNHTCDMHMTK